MIPGFPLAGFFVPDLSFLWLELPLLSSDTGKKRWKHGLRPLLDSHGTVWSDGTEMDSWAGIPWHENAPDGWVSFDLNTSVLLREASLVAVGRLRRDDGCWAPSHWATPKDNVPDEKLAKAKIAVSAAHLPQVNFLQGKIGGGSIFGTDAQRTASLWLTKPLTPHEWRSIGCHPLEDKPSFHFCPSQGRFGRQGILFKNAFLLTDLADRGIASDYLVYTADGLVCSDVKVKDPKKLEKFLPGARFLKVGCKLQPSEGRDDVPIPVDLLPCFDLNSDPVTNGIGFLVKPNYQSVPFSKLPRTIEHGSVILDSADRAALYVRLDGHPDKYLEGCKTYEVWIDGVRRGRLYKKDDVERAPTKKARQKQREQERLELKKRFGSKLPRRWDSLTDAEMKEWVHLQEHIADGWVSSQTVHQWFSEWMGSSIGYCGAIWWLKLTEPVRLINPDTKDIYIPALNKEEILAHPDFAAVFKQAGIIGFMQDVIASNQAQGSILSQEF